MLLNSEISCRSNLQNKLDNILDFYISRKKGCITLVEGESTEIMGVCNYLAKSLNVNMFSISHRDYIIDFTKMHGHIIIICNLDNMLHWPSNSRIKILSELFKMRNKMHIVLGYRKDKSMELLKIPVFKKLTNEIDFIIRLNPLSEDEILCLIKLFCKKKPHITYNKNILPSIVNISNGSLKYISALLNQLEIEAKRKGRKVISASLMEEIFHDTS